MQKIILFLFAGIVVATACNDRIQSESHDSWIPKQQPLADNNPMKKFESFVGKWDCIEKSWLAGNVENSFKSTAQIYFLTDHLTLCVDHTGVDAPFRFIGYHKYDSDLGKYVNWGASNHFPTGGYALEVYDSTKNEFTFEIHMYLYNNSETMKSDSPTPIHGTKSVWKIISKDEHKFTAWITSENGEDLPLKEVLYTRANKSTDTR